MSSTNPSSFDFLGGFFQAHPWHGVPARTKIANTFNSYIEIVPTDTVKYEVDKNSGHLRVDRPQLFSSVCPTLYGFIPQTYCGDLVAERCNEKTGLTGIQGDGDAIDICVLTEKTVSHGNIFCNARPIGGFRMIDGDEADDKIIAVLEADIQYGHIQDIADCPPGVIDRLKHYFLSYKQIPNVAPPKVNIAELYGRAEALEVIERSLVDYRKKFGTAEEQMAKLRALLAAQ